MSALVSVVFFSHSLSLVPLPSNFFVLNNKIVFRIISINRIFSGYKTFHVVFLFHFRYMFGAFIVVNIGAEGKRINYKQYFYLRITKK